MNTCSLTVVNVISAELGRKTALEKYVMGNDKLHEEFYLSIKENLLDMSPAEIVEALTDFIKGKNITILSEKPFVVLDKANNWYRVNVMYTIAM